jgi:hypothetical protein
VFSPAYIRINLRRVIVLYALLAYCAVAYAQASLKLACGFEANRGQWLNDSGYVDTTVLYRLNAPGLIVNVYQEGIQYQLLQYVQDTTPNSIALSSNDSLLYPELLRPQGEVNWVRTQVANF